MKKGFILASVLLIIPLVCYALEYFRDYNYGMGKDYPKTAESRGNEILNDPAGKLWYKQSKYVEK